VTQHPTHASCRHGWEVTNWVTIVGDRDGRPWTAGD
jgi:hypothetical protein